MRKTLLFALLVTLLLKVVVANTVEPDSLLGTYVGEKHLRDFFLCDTCRIITIDTFCVRSIDTVNCKTIVYGDIIPIADRWEFNLVTEYNICYDSIQNWFYGWAKFYNKDSVEMYFQEFSRPPDLGYHPYGFHFWGKRISSEFLSAHEVKAISRLVNIASVGEEIIIETNNSETGNFQLMNLSGRILHQSKIKSTRTAICAPSTGVLIYRFVNSKGEVQSGKVMVN